MGTFIKIAVRVMKLTVIFWPFFISVVFGGRPVKEVLMANRLFTIMFVFLLTIAFTLVITTITLMNLRQDHAARRVQLREINVEVNAVRLQNSRLTERLGQCVSTDYDPIQTLERLNIYRGH